MNTPYLFKRGSRYYFRRPIPRHLQHIWKRKEVVVSLKTGDYQIALQRYVIECNKLSSQFYVVETGGRISVGTGYTADVLRTGFDLRQIKAVAIDTEPVEAIFAAVAQNVKRVSEWPTVVKSQADALASTIKTHLPWDDFFDRFKKLDRDHFSAKQNQRAKNKRYTPKRNAIDTFVSFFPDLTNVLAITHQHALSFKDKLLDLVESGELHADTANKKLVHLRTVYAKVFKADFPGEKNPFEGVSIKVHAVGKRKPFSAADIAKIESHFNSSDASEELKALNFIAMNTGAHQKELVYITKGDIHLHAPIPYIRIADNEFRDKVKSGGARHRDIPLVGKALEWCQKFPDGFPTYRKSGGADNVSAASNKHLKPLTGKTFYGYRHRIADLLRNSGCNDSLKDSIMGHTTPGIGSHYGEGYTLAKKRDALATALSQK
jgi:integrase